MEPARELDLLAGGSFERQSPMEWRVILEFFLEASSSYISHNEPHQESESIHKSLLIDKFELQPCTPMIRLESLLPNREHRRKKRFNLRCSLTYSRMILLETL
jgi:hypothetical protein